jgi:hypothetical protein
MNGFATGEIFINVPVRLPYNGMARTDIFLKEKLAAIERGETVLFMNYESSVNEERLKEMLKDHRNPEHEDYIGPDQTQEDTSDWNMTDAQKRIRYGNNKKKRTKTARKTSAKIVKQSKKRNR